MISMTTMSWDGGLKQVFSGRVDMEVAGEARTG